MQRVEDLAATVRKAFVIANSGRKGPVLIDIPKDVTAAVTEYIPLPKYRIRKLPKVDEEKFEEAMNAIKAAKRPMIYSGGGIISAGATRSAPQFPPLRHAVRPQSRHTAATTAIPPSARCSTSPA